MRNIHLRNRTLHIRNGKIKHHRRIINPLKLEHISETSSGSGFHNTNLERLRSSLASLTLSKPKKKYIKF